jgi:U3 small nucleolar RNA-associated protein 3
VAKHAKTIEAKLRIARGGAEEDEEEDDDDDNERRAGWGANKRSYYEREAADLEGSEDDEDAREEEEEALRLQREAAAALHPEDFGLGLESDEESSGDEDDGVDVEQLCRDPDAFTEEERLAAVRRDALELGALARELRAALSEVRSRLGPLLQEVRAGGLATAEGVSYLEAKHLLLLQYAASVAFYLLLRAEGRPARDHPVVARLVEIRTYLEKIRPIDKLLSYQVEKLLAAAAAARGGGEVDGAAGIDGGGGDDALKFGPRPGALVIEGDRGATTAAAAEENGGRNGGDGMYRPPRLNPISMDLEEGGPSAADRRRLLRERRQAQRSDLVRELARELAGAPDELGAAPVGGDTAAMARGRARLRERDEVEEDLMIRVPLSREERRRLKAQRRDGMSGKALLDDFADDLAGLVDGDGDGGALAPFAAHRAGQRFGADQMPGDTKSKRSGDADLPAREPLNERRAKMDGAKARRAAMDNDEGPEEAGGVEDDFYRAARDSAAMKKAQRGDAYKRPATLPPRREAQATGARKITKGGALIIFL